MSGVFGESSTTGASWSHLWILFLSSILSHLPPAVYSQPNLTPAIFTECSSSPFLLTEHSACPAKAWCFKACPKDVIRQGLQEPYCQKRYPKEIRAPSFGYQIVETNEHYGIIIPPRIPCRKMGKAEGLVPARGGTCFPGRDFTQSWDHIRGQDRVKTMLTMGRTTP